MLVYQRVNVFIFPKLSKGGGSKPINYNKDPENSLFWGTKGGLIRAILVGIISLFESLNSPVAINTFTI